MKLPRIVILSTLGLAAGLTTRAATGGTPACVWPPPPAPARVAAEGSFASPADLGLGPTLGERWVELLTGASRGREKLRQPFGVAVDEAGNVCLTDTGAGTVWYLDRVKRRFLRWAEINQVRFKTPVAVAKADGVIYVADSGLGQVVAFDEAGRVRYRIEAPLVRPAGVAVAGGRLHVADAGAHALLVFDGAGKLLRRFGQRGTAAGELNFPTHVAVAADGRLYVTDAMNFRIQIFDAEGNCLGQLGGAGDGSGHFSRPKGVAVDSCGHVYVSDALFDNIQIFDRDGAFLLNLGAPGRGLGEFWMPAGIAITRDNRIFVADACNGRVQMLRYLGNP